MRCAVLFALLATSSLAGATEPNTASPAEPDHATAATAAQPKPLKVVCKLEKPMGSQMLKRRCYTADELERMQEDARRDVDRAQHNKG